MTQKELEDIYIILEKQYRKAFVQGYEAALGDRVNRKQVQSWMWAGRFQNFEIWEDPMDQHQIPVALQKQNYAYKKKQVYFNLKQHLELKTL